MELEYLISTLAENASRIRCLVEGVSIGQARWKPDPDSWSILEVVNHLLDEERLDFRVRIDYSLYRTGEKAPPIDPGGWVTARQYNQRDPETSLREFLAEREASLEWLRGMSAPDWETTYTAPWGPIAAGDFLASWVAHDLLHIRQLVEVHWAYTMTRLPPYRADYAGAW